MQMIDVRQIRSLSEFQRNAREFLKKLAEDRNPIVLTVNGKAEAVVLDPATYQSLSEMADNREFLAAVKEGIADMDAGRVTPLKESIRRVEEKYGL